MVINSDGEKQTVSSVQQLNLAGNGDGREGDRRKKSIFDPSINVGTIIHLIGVLIAIILYGAAFDKRTTLLEMQVQQQGETLRLMHKQMDRLERYQSSVDKNYWRKAKDNGGED